MSNLYQHFGRYAPAEVATIALRQWLKRGVFLAAAATALSSTNAAKAQDGHPLHSPIAAERVAAEIEAIEADFGFEVDIVHIEHNQYTDAGDTTFDPDGAEGTIKPFRVYYTPRIAEIEAELLKAFNAAGTFDARKNGQIAPVDNYLPEDKINATTDEVNQILARHIAQSTLGSLINPEPIGVYAVPMDFNTKHGERRRVCLIRLNTSLADEDFFMRDFIGVNAHGIDHELADLQQFIANHELAHCLTSEGGVPPWALETMADAYALTRHMQLNGEDGFADTLLSIRRFNAFHDDGGSHNTVPGLERLIPRLREANAQGRLDGLTPRQIRSLSFELLLGATEPEAKQAAQELTKEYDRQNRAYKFLQEVGEAQDGRLTLKEGTPLEVVVLTERTVTAVNTAVVHLTRPNALLKAAEVNSSEAEVDFRENMDEYIATQPSAQVALEGVRARLFSLDRLQEAFVTKNGQDKLHELMDAYGEDKITLSRKREIFQGYETQLEQALEAEAAHPPNNTSRSMS